jgi:ribosomal-protein-alanine N-acetyltransferase
MASSDVPSAHSILKESPEAAIWSEEALLSSVSRDLCWAAETNGRLAGILIGRAAADEFEILNLAVAKSARRRGIAAKLVHAALEYAQSNGASQIYLEVRASNEIAIALYSRMGFRANGRRPNYYRHPAEDAVLLVLHKNEDFH